MTTLAKLQAHLNTKRTQLIPGYFHKELAELVNCADGVTLSVQASETHYSEPRNNFGPYSEVEVWRINGCTTPITQFEYEEDEPSGYVPIEQVVAFINQHGGFKE